MEHGYLEYLKHIAIFGPTVMYEITPLNFIHVAYLSMLTLTGAPCEEPKQFLDTPNIGLQICVTLFNMYFYIEL